MDNDLQTPVVEEPQNTENAAASNLTEGMKYYQSLERKDKRLMFREYLLSINDEQYGISTVDRRTLPSLSNENTVKKLKELNLGDDIYNVYSVADVNKLIESFNSPEPTPSESSLPDSYVDDATRYKEFLVNINKKEQSSTLEHLLNAAKYLQKTTLEEYLHSSLEDRVSAAKDYVSIDVKASTASDYTRIIKKFKKIPTRNFFDFTDKEEIESLFQKFTENYKDDSGSGNTTKNWYIRFIQRLKNNSKESKPEQTVEHNHEFSIEALIDNIKNTGLYYPDSLIKRYAFSLMAKRFLILSGLAGSGKTQLALVFADALIESDKQKCVVSVGADWTNREPLLGYMNALAKGEYVKPENKVVDLLIEANKPENADKPYFLILDEMNMSYVERYFADFLSSMESGEPIRLFTADEPQEGEIQMSKNGVPEQLYLPANLFIIGTINVDETTYMFSPKVLDRANVIEFKIGKEDMVKFLEALQPVDRASIKGQAANLAEDFVRIAKEKVAQLAEDDRITTTLTRFFEQLKQVNAEFGYRTATEIIRFVQLATAGKQMDLNDALDCAIVQKMMPKLHGSRQKLDGVLRALWKICFNEPGSAPELNSENTKDATYKLTADKLVRMYNAAQANGFTSFAEA